ncbi:MAG: hypothetical protein AAF675_14285 [Pseudomonadota bacterium]
MFRPLALLVPLAFLAACADGSDDGPAAGGTSEAPVASTTPQPGTPALSLPGQAPAATAPARQFAPEDVPSIHLGVDQRDGRNGVIFAIDLARDGDPRNDEAIRISARPDGTSSGQCEATNLPAYPFAPAGPVFSHVEANQGVTLGEMPRFLAFRSSQALVQAGLASDPEETAAENICVRKFWELKLREVEPRSGAQGS